MVNMQLKGISVHKFTVIYFCFLFFFLDSEGMKQFLLFLHYQFRPEKLWLEISESFSTSWFFTSVIDIAVVLLFRFCQKSAYNG